jgi:hypothetical protein
MTPDICDFCGDPRFARGIVDYDPNNPTKLYTLQIGYDMIGVTIDEEILILLITQTGQKVLARHQPKQ